MIRRLSIAATAGIVAVTAVIVTSSQAATTHPADPPSVTTTAQSGAAAQAARAAAAHARAVAHNVATGGHDSSYVPLAPCRAVDTLHANGGYMRANVTRTFVVSGTTNFPQQGGTSGGCNVPSWATAVTANLSASYITGIGAVHAWAAGRTMPSAASLEFLTGQHPLSGVTIPISPSGVSIRPDNAKGHIAMDITGYFAPSIYAVVSSNSTLLYSSRLAVTSHTAGTGAYVLTADTSVTSCSVVAAGWGSYSAAAYGSGSSINVNTFNASHQPSDAYFQVTITC